MNDHRKCPEQACVPEYNLTKQVSGDEETSVMLSDSLVGVLSNDVDEKLERLERISRHMESTV